MFGERRFTRLGLVVASAALPALLIAAPSSAVITAPAKTAAQKGIDVKGFITKSVDFADNADRWISQGKVPATWELTRVFTFEADGYTKGYNAATQATQVNRWKILVGLQWTLPDNSHEIHTLVTNYKKGQRQSYHYHHQAVFQDLVFPGARHNFKWAWNRMADWQNTKSVFSAFKPPIGFNLRNPLYPPFKKHPSWIFEVGLVDGSRGFIFVNDKSGKVTFEQES